MSGAGLVSIRLPRSVMEALEANSLRAGMDKHEATRRLVLHLEQLTDDQLANLPEPPRELDNPRVSLYVGWPQTEALAAVSRRTQLSTSCIVRRLVYGLVASGSIDLDQSEESPELHLTHIQHRAEGLERALFPWMILAVVTVVIAGVVLRYRWIRTHRTKPKTVPRRPTPSVCETPKGADPQ